MFAAKGHYDRSSEEYRRFHADKMTAAWIVNVMVPMVKLEVSFKSSL